MPNNSFTNIDTVRRRSLDVLKENQHLSGAYPAAIDFKVYRYCWFRDGSFIADAMSRVGEIESATRFHHWCARVIDDRQPRIQALVDRHRAGEKIAASEMLPTRYTLDGADGAEIWWDYQLDGYGTWLWALTEHVNRHDLDLEPFQPAMEALVGYLQAFGSEPCFDWWEEFETERHVSTLACVAAGLDAASALADPSVSASAAMAAEMIRKQVLGSAEATGHLTKWIGSNAVDGSLISSSVPLGVIEPGGEIAEVTYKKVIQSLLKEGVYRYLGDTFYGGGEWIILTAWLGWYELATGRVELAEKRRDWIVAQATSEGDLPEQVSNDTQAPDRIAEWQEKWGTVATPLLWSHAMFLTLDHAIESQR